MEEQKARYYIDERWFTENNKSFRTFAQARMCPQCRKKLGTEVQERVPTVDARSRVIYEVRAVPFGSNPTSEIRKHCSKESGYITAETPLLEALFRVFLANGNQPIDAEQIQEQLATYVPPSEKPNGYRPELLTRVLESPNNYGLRLFEMGQG
ncbi:MAG TPA: hypothetical protein VFZ25_03000 [Chloroflexota bacterium]|nr:hypothetical protein [Chloroflexota bacterium]